MICLPGWKWWLGCCSQQCRSPLAKFSSRVPSRQIQQQLSILSSAVSHRFNCSGLCLEISQDFSSGLDEPHSIKISYTNCVQQRNGQKFTSGLDHKSQCYFQSSVWINWFRVLALMQCREEMNRNSLHLRIGSQIMLFPTSSLSKIVLKVGHTSWSAWKPGHGLFLDCNHKMSPAWTKIVQLCIEMLNTGILEWVLYLTNS